MIEKVECSKCGTRLQNLNFESYKYETFLGIKIRKLYLAKGYIQKCPTCGLSNIKDNKVIFKNLNIIGRIFSKLGLKGKLKH